MYDVTNRKSFQDILEWLKDLNEYSQGERMNILLIGNKNENEYFRQVSIEEGIRMAESKGMIFREMSCKDDNSTSVIIDGLKELVEYLSIDSGSSQAQAQAKTLVSSNLKITRFTIWMHVLTSYIIRAFT